MREIKFRAWDAFNAEMFPTKENDDLLVKFFREVNKRRNCGNPVHVMQYIGLEDKNGKEIYEGDVLEWKPEYMRLTDRRVVRYREYGYAPFLYDGGDELPANECEVIGNIYENPEMVHGKVA